MKKPILFAGICPLLISAIVFWKCSQETPKPSKTTIFSSSNVNKEGVSPAPQGTCTCGPKPSGCPDFVNCLSKLIGNGNSKTFKVTWESCVDPDPGNTSCNGFGISGAVSTLTICYTPGKSECTDVTCVLANPPSCLPCLANTTCIQLGIQCNTAKNTFALIGNELNPITNINTTVTISGDPKVTVTCGQGGDNYSCTGSLQ